MSLASLRGLGRCDFCGRRSNPVEVYGGRYDVDPRRAITREQAMQMRRFLERRSDPGAAILLAQLENNLPELFAREAPKPKAKPRPRKEKPAEAAAKPRKAAPKKRRKMPARRRRRVARPAEREPALALFEGIDDVRRGIVMSEILGRPKGMS